MVLKNDKGAQGNLEGDVRVHFLDYGDGFKHVCVYMSELIKLHTSNVCSLLCINYTSIKPLKIALHRNPSRRPPFS